MNLLANIKESFYSSLSTLRVNKLRTFLTLFGITIGIFAIIPVFTVIESLEKTIRQSLSSPGDDIIYVQKWPLRPVPAFQQFGQTLFGNHDPTFYLYLYSVNSKNIAQ
ncbi:MAG: ABC transporter permease [Bacteroidales bacterium]|nr:ABC transporter permease [Bacteroidales bacterium]